MAINFSEQLRKLRRQTAAVSGRQPSREEVAGVAEGVAESASARLARGRGLELEKERIGLEQERVGLAETQLGQQQTQFEENLAEQKRVTDLEAAAARSAEEKQEKAQKTQNIVAGGAAGAFLLGGTILGGPVAFAVGAAFTAAASSWVCNAVEKEAGLSISASKTLIKFKKYALEKHKSKTEYYLEVGPQIVEEMFKQGAVAMFHDLKDELVLPVVRLFDSDEPEKAYDLYKHKILELMAMYKPELLKEVPHGE